MKILKLECNNFRNIEEIVLFPCDEMNVICGENAQGKTNLIEAIWLFTGAKSFRGAKDIDLLKFKSEKSTIKLDFTGEGIKKEALIEIKEKRKAFLNQNKLKTPSLLAGNFNAIVFSPNDLKIVAEGPNIRRKFLDLALGQLYPSYIEILKNYTRAVLQRNKIIKEYKYDSTIGIMLEVFEKEIAQNGKKIINYRKKYINFLNLFLPFIYNGLSRGKETLNISYVYKTDGENLEETLKFLRKEDMYTGITSIGPHRDDIDFTINGISARNFASQGQKRSIALAIKLAEAEILKKNIGEYPIFLLDDVMSELDPLRQEFILNHIKGMQTFLTCCDPSNFKNLKAGKIFNIEEGGVI